MITEEELETLLDALNAWENEPDIRHMATLPMVIAMSSDADEAKRDFEESGEGVKAEVKRRKYIAILLKAKMIQIANSGLSQSVSDYVNNDKKD